MTKPRADTRPGSSGSQNKRTNPTHNLHPIHDHEKVPCPKTTKENDEDKKPLSTVTVQNGTRIQVIKEHPISQKAINITMVEEMLQHRYNPHKLSKEERRFTHGVSLNKCRIVYLDMQEPLNDEDIRNCCEDLEVKKAP